MKLWVIIWISNWFIWAILKIGFVEIIVKIRDNLLCVINHCMNVSRFYDNSKLILSSFSRLYNISNLILSSLSEQSKTNLYLMRINWLFRDGVSHHIEISPLICRANRWTGFYVIATKRLIIYSPLGETHCNNVQGG